MSRLVLVRHGQASFGAADYDVLSEVGREQARALGRHLVDLASPDAIYVGPRRRQRDTLAEMIAGAGRALPTATELAPLDEYPAIELFRRWLPELARTDARFAELLAGPGAHASPRLQEAFEEIVARWARGDLDVGDLESFAGFHARVGGVLEHIMTREGRGRTIWVVTSGGPIALAVQRCLALEATVALGLGWSIGNASWSELRYAGPRLSLHGFNHLTHLPSHLVTYR